MEHWEIVGVMGMAEMYRKLLAMGICQESFAMGSCRELLHMGICKSLLTRGL